MVYEDYNLLSIRTRLSEEFGIDIVNIADNLTIIDKRINDAVAWIVNRRKNWPWMEDDANIDVGELSTSLVDVRYGSGICYKMQRQITNCIFSQTAIAPREMVDFSGDGSSGIMATAYAVAQITLEHAYLDSPQICAVTNITATSPMVVTVTLTDSDGATVVLPANVSTFTAILAGHTVGAGTDPDGTHVATRISATTFSIPVDGTVGPLVVTAYGTAQIAREFTIAQSLFQCPDNFIKSESLHQDIETDWNRINFRNTNIFEREIRADRVISNINRIYTVHKDPLGLVDNKYIVIFPYYTDRNVLHLKYYGSAPKMVADADVPAVPIADRFVVLNAAGWFVAQWQKDVDMITFYRAGALNELERMAIEYQMADDTS